MFSGWRLHIVPIRAHEVGKPVRSVVPLFDNPDGSRRMCQNPVVRLCPVELIGVTESRRTALLSRSRATRSYVGTDVLASILWH